MLLFYACLTARPIATGRHRRRMGFSSSSSTSYRSITTDQSTVVFVIRACCDTGKTDGCSCSDHLTDLGRRKKILHFNVVASDKTTAVTNESVHRSDSCRLRLSVNNLTRQRPTEENIINKCVDCCLL